METDGEHVNMHETPARYSGFESHSSECQPRRVWYLPLSGGESYKLSSL